MTRALQVGRVPVGGGAPVSIQSMCNTDTRDARSTLAQIRELAQLGCEIIRVAVPDADAAAALPVLVAESPLPVIADIHFDHRLALAALAAGVAGIRLNPGNLCDAAAVRAVAAAAERTAAVIRVGANSGSVRSARVRELEAAGLSHDDAMGEALAQSALEQCALLEACGFSRIKVSLKSSSVPVTVRACRKFAERSDYPQHIGITEAGTPERGIIKSAVGIGALLLAGIGDTIRVSLTAPPAAEVLAARRILESCGLREAHPELVSCPTCGRTRIDLVELANRVERLVAALQGDGYRLPFRKLAVMGCAVNGPGEARDADLGMAGAANGQVVLFRRGEILGAFGFEEAFERFAELLKAAGQRSRGSAQA